MSEPQRVLSLFSGIGGLDLACESAGFRVIAMCEREPFCRDVLAYHWPDVPIYEDVHNVTAERLRQDGLWPIHGIIGGPPCQPASVAGKRAGQADDRWLWPAFLRVVRETRAAWFVAENPQGVLSVPDALGRPGGAFRAILAECDESGYRVGWQTWGAADVGAPHQRDRVFLFGWRAGGELADYGATRTARPDHSEGTVADADEHGGGWAQRTERGDVGSASPADAGDEGHPQRHATECGGATLADAAQRGVRRRATSRQGRQPAQPGEVAVSVAHAHDAQRERSGRARRGRAEPSNRGRGGAQPGVGDIADGLPAGLAGYTAHASLISPRTTFPGWPSGPQEAQHEWEPSRTTRERIPDRAAKLKALGNAVVPQQAMPLFMALAEVLAEMDAADGEEVPR